MLVCGMPAYQDGDICLYMRDNKDGREREARSTSWAQCKSVSLDGEDRKVAAVAVHQRQRPY